MYAVASSVRFGPPDLLPVGRVIVGRIWNFLTTRNTITAAEEAEMQRLVEEDKDQRFISAIRSAVRDVMAESGLVTRIEHIEAHLGGVESIRGIQEWLDRYTPKADND